MITWNPVIGSTRIVAEAYIPDFELILVRFTDGVEWAYPDCTEKTWQEFTTPGQSRGKYIAEVLNNKAGYGPWCG